MKDGPGRKPVIGVSTSFLDFGDYLGVGYHKPVSLAGGVPVILPRVPEALDDLLALCDGIMIAAGHDLDPTYYGQTPGPHLHKTDPGRDRFEVDLVRRASALGLPLLGSCRGIQVINVALGGTLVQDLGLVPAWTAHPSDPSWACWAQVQDAAMHDDPLPEHPRHALHVEHGSLLHQALATTAATVDSFHHQACDTVAPGLRVSARAPDGVVEAIERADPFVLALQCELHEAWRVDRRFLRVFELFVRASARRAALV